MKKCIFFAVAMMIMSACGFQRNSAAGTSSSSTTDTQVTATSAGQNVGNALLGLYTQYKADGNKYDYQNMNNILNTVTLVGNCAGLKNNYKDKTYLSEFGQGMIASSLGLVTQDNVERVTDSLVDMMKNNEKVQDSKTKAQETASTAASYANTAAQYAGALSAILGAFSQNE